MITKSTLAELSDFFKIDTFTVMREYLQLIFLSWLYREKKADYIFFKGGTSLRLIFGSPRFSEDLDFSTLYPEKAIRLIIAGLEISIKSELSGIKIVHLYSGVNTSRFRLIFRQAEFKYPFVIRLDFNRVKRTEKIIASPVVTRFPVSLLPVINHLSAKEILAEKICALFMRTKGRDVFDVWYLLEKEIALDNNLIKQKINEYGAGFSGQDIIKKIQNYPEKELELDLKQFLPAPHRKTIATLKSRLLEKFSRL